MDQLVQDLRYALRSLRRSPGFAVVAVLTLALGIGANTAVFSVIDGTALKPLPYPAPDRIAFLSWGDRTGSIPFLSPAKFAFTREHTRSFAGVATWQWASGTLGQTDHPERLTGLRVSDDFLRVFGLAPVRGRGFTPAENAPGGPPVILITTGFWQSHLGGDPDVLGTRLRLGDTTYTVVGVVPAVRLPNGDATARYILPLRLVADPRNGANNYRVVARLRPGVPWSAAAAELRAEMPGFRRAYPELAQPGDRGMLLLSYRQAYIGSAIGTLWLLLGAVVFVLLIACGNVASLMLVRATGRGRELAIRAAVGASRGRVVRQLLLESGVLAVLAAGAGLLLGDGALRAMLLLVRHTLDRADEIALDGRVLGFTVLVALASGALVGLISALPITRPDLIRWLREAGTGSRGGRTGQRARQFLVATQTALTLVLLAAAGLLIASFAALRGVDLGFDPKGLVGARLAAARTGAGGPGGVAAEWNFEERLLERIRLSPGVSAAATAANLPLDRGWNIPITVDGRPDATEGAAEWRGVSPQYFATTGMRLLRGRDFTRQDGAGAPGVVIVNEAAARHYWPGADPLGHRLAIGRMAGRLIAPDLAEPERVVVGVVGDAQDVAPGEEIHTTVFVPRAQMPAGLAGPPALLLRAGSPRTVAAELERVVHEVDPGLARPEVVQLTDLFAEALLPQRILTTLVAIFAALAVSLAVVGIYGILAYSVRQRAGEIALRLTLGAHQRQIVALVIRQGVLVVGSGFAVGLLGALALMRVLAHGLYGVHPADPRVLAGAGFLLAGGAALASVLPARRAARIDPVTALRSD